MTVDNYLKRCKLAKTALTTIVVIVSVVTIFYMLVDNGYKSYLSLLFYIQYLIQSLRELIEIAERKYLAKKEALTNKTTNMPTNTLNQQSDVERTTDDKRIKKYKLIANSSNFIIAGFLIATRILVDNRAAFIKTNYRFIFVGVFFSILIVGAVIEIYADKLIKKRKKAASGDNSTP